ncbi:glycosyltransferase [Rhodococcus sp. BP-316]|uniref:glycosyltransferase n=1 Tax=Rhodococcus sp. BP-316 TaxID=2739445 RepID=UPI001C9A9B9A|nr:glycosyltransferase [Rhodococcus sp. BP-316]MBY6683445.1 glycosyltransferase [Rhodococcus sp. BP-316]
MQSTAPATIPHSGHDRLVLQRGVFLGPSTRVNPDLYVQIEKGSGDRRRHDMTLAKNSFAHTNTYFGRFAASYWQRWTTVGAVTASLRIATSGRVRVRLLASDIAGHRRIVSVQETRSDAVLTFEAPLDKFVDGGALWLEFETFGESAVVDCLEWTHATTVPRRPVAIAICTFNRATDCAHTVAALASDDVVLSLIDTVHVVDQGTDLVQDQPEFADARARMGDTLVYLRQPNLGGAGGFTRGLYEVTASRSGVDVILMDDDILCEPETVLRLSAFANVTAQPTLVGAQMLFLLNPDYLNVGAEEVDFLHLQHGRTVGKALSNKSMIKKNQERRVDAGYNAWWTCLIPSEVVEEIGLPLPMFFQWDDVEYGVRAGRAGFPTVTLPNAAVWHADFYWKDFDDWARYFSTRNSLIVGSLHSDLNTTVLSRMFLRHIAEYVVGMQYGLAHTTLKGIEDWLSGPDHLADGGMAAMARIRADRKEYPETIMHPAATAPVPSAEVRVSRAGGEPSAMRAVLAKRGVDQFLGRTIGGLVGVTREDAHWWHIARFDHVVVTDASQGGVRIRKRDKARGVALMVRAVKVMRRLRREAPALQEQYRAAGAELIARENWARLYGIDADAPTTESVR